MTARERFGKRVLKTDDCWIWMGGRGSHGYGGFYAHGEQLLAHRYSYELFIGDPTGLVICHHCDNKLCVRPDHLFAGTQSDNLNDMTRKGRRRTRRKLSDEVIAEIRRRAQPRWTRGGTTRAVLAREYGVNRQLIDHVVSKNGYGIIPNGR